MCKLFEEAVWRALPVFCTREFTGQFTESLGILRNPSSSRVWRRAFAAFRERERACDRSDARLEAAAAARFVETCGADDDPLLRRDEALGATRGRAAPHADGARFRDLLGGGHERGHRLKRPPEVVLVETRGNHALAEVSQAARDVDDSGVEELYLVETHDLRARVGSFEDLGRGRDGEREESEASVGDHLDLREGVVDVRLED